jgi:hypothetical protein
VYKFCQSCTKCTYYVRDLTFQDLNLISIILLTIYILSVLSCLDLVLSVTSFSSVECLYTLFYTLIETKLAYTTLVWNSIMSTDADKLESIQQNLGTLLITSFSIRIRVMLCFTVLKIRYLSQEELSHWCLITT